MQKLISGLVLVAGIAGIVIPAFFPDKFLTMTMQIISGVFVICVAYIELVGFLFRRTPLTVVRSTVAISLSHDKSIAKCVRRQVIRTNKPNVSAYFAASRPGSPTGTVVDLEFDAYCSGALNIKSEVAKFGDKQRGYEVFHSFSRNLRHRFWMPLIPASFLKKDRVEDYFSFIGDNLLVRTQTYTYENEYNIDTPRMRFRVEDYPQHNVEIKLVFEGGIPADLKVKRVQPLGVTDIETRTELLEKNTIYARVKKLKNEALVVYWNQ